MITLFLLGKKGFETLTKLEELNLFNVSKVIIGTDKNVAEDYSREIEFFCLKNSIEHSKSPKENLFNTKYAIAIGWKRLINYHSGQKLIVFHDSILPRLRGFNPLVTALINGDKEVGVTAIFASEEYDKGDIIDIEKIKINYPLKIEKAIKLISECYSILGNRIISKLNKGKLLVTTKQIESLATYSLWRDDEDYFINWNDDANKISRQIDAVGYPYKGAKAIIENQIITISDGEPINDVEIENRSSGKIIFMKDNNPIVVCGKGLLLIKEAIDSNNQNVDLSKKFRLRFK
jgi:methionyl-tRNA formyltransferase